VVEVGEYCLVRKITWLDITERVDNAFVCGGRMNLSKKTFADKHKPAVRKFKSAAHLYLASK